MPMRSKYLLITTMILVLFFISIPANGSIIIFGSHISPSYPEVGEEIELFITVRDPENIGISSVECTIDDSNITMNTDRFQDQEDMNWTEGVLFRCTWEVEGGDHNITYNIIDNNGNITFLGPIPLLIQEDEKDEEDTIFGLPKTYFAVSVIFITLIIIFLTWSYFKGRRMQKEVEASTGASNITCSACGVNISVNDEKCPKCGAVFDEEEHVCGNCGKVISEMDTKCPECGSKLRSSSGTIKSSSSERKDLDLKKLNRKEINMTGKIKCSECGSVYMKKEKRCPECDSDQLRLTFNS